MNLFTMNIYLTSGQVISCQYKDDKAANIQGAKVAGAMATHDPAETTEIVDDFGIHMNLLSGQIAGCVVIDQAQAAEFGIEQALFQARVQQKANKRAQSDPMLNNQNNIVTPNLITPNLARPIRNNS